MFEKDYYKEAYKTLKKENKDLRDSVQSINKASEKKDDTLEKVIEENAELRERMDELQKKGGSIVGIVTQTKNKYSEDELEPQGVI